MDLKQQTEKRLSMVAARRIDTMVPTIARGDRVTLLTDRTFIADVDLIAVERAVNNEIDPATLTRAEQEAAGRVLIARGCGASEAARRTGLPADTLRQLIPDAVQLRRSLRKKTAVAA